MQYLHSYVQQLKLRLTDLSQRNRSLKLLKLSPYRDFDLESISILNGKTSTEILNKLIASQSVPLIKQLSPQLRDILAGDIRLNRIYRTLQTIFEESGTYSLKLGFPFVSGKLLDETQVRCPLLFIPARLVKSTDAQKRWVLEPFDKEPIQLNSVFFRAYEKANRHPFSTDFWETDFSEAANLQQVFLQFHEIVKTYNLSLKIDSQVFIDSPQPFIDWSQSQIESLPTGVLTVTPEIVLGVFPQTDAAIVQDYNSILAEFNALISDFNQPSGSTTDAFRKLWPGILPQDSSQAEVLNKLRQGHSVAVNGPPGSGKSQLIVNALTEYLASGKSVLVVSQKRAALEVVLNRLQDIGIASFCLCIHDYQNDKNIIYKQLAFQIAQIRQYETEVRTLDQANWEANFLASCQKQQQRFEFHEKVYHELLATQPCGLRLFDLYCLHPRPEVPIILPKLLYSTTWNEWQHVYKKIQLISDFWPTLTQNNLWKNRKSIHNQSVIEILRLFQQAVSDSNERENLLQKREYGIYLEHAQAKSFLEHQHLLCSKTKYSVVAYARSNQFDVVNQAIEKIPILHEIFSALKKISLLPLENPNKILQFLEHLETLDELQDSIFKIFKSSWHSSHSFVNQFLSRFNFGEQQIAQLRQEATVIRECLRKISILKINPILQEWPEINQLNIWEEKLLEIKNIEIFWKWFLIWEKETLIVLKPDPTYWEKLTQQATTTLQAAVFQQNIYELLAPLFYEDQLNKILNSTDTTSQLIDAQNFIQKHIETVQLVDSWIAELKPQEQAVIGWIFKSTENKPDTFYLNQIEQSLCFHWIQEAEIKNPFLRETSTSIWENLSNEVQKEDSNLRFLALELLRHRLKNSILKRLQYNQRNNLLTFRDLNHQVTKKSKIWPIRKLFQHFWKSEVKLLTPCVLASPETVSAIFEMHPQLFDLVIFDEASQCPVERAFPTFWRGKQVLIAGDEQQLPPYDLYQTKIELPEEYELIDDKLITSESLLQFAHGYMESIPLRGHYRSLFPELIAFSNQHFYDDRLETISLAIPDTTYYPSITCIKENGIWENQQNVREATAVLEYLPAILQQFPNDSLGIITFNFTQQELILNELEKFLTDIWNETERQLVYQALSQTRSSEKLFIKNIENVQGDERDIIILTTGYAPDKNGKLRYSFGSLSNLGGEKRLNVAITRARKKLILITSLEAAYFSNYTGSSLGVQLFGKFLNYVQTFDNQNIRLQKNDTQVIANGSLDPITLYLTKALQEKGIVVAQKVGVATLQVDLALAKPNNPERFILGIWVDGPNQFSRPSSQDIILYQPNIFCYRNWNIMFISARKFWQNPEKIVQNIIFMLDTVKS